MSAIETSRAHLDAQSVLGLDLVAQHVELILAFRVRIAAGWRRVCAIAAELGLHASAQCDQRGQVAALSANFRTCGPSHDGDAAGAALAPVSHRTGKALEDLRLAEQPETIS